MDNKFKLYTWSVSLYSGKARAYLIKQHIDFDDISPADPHYDAVIRPALGRWIIPVMETPEQEIVQDGTEIIDWFENRQPTRLPAYPQTPRQLISSLIMEFFGGEGLLRPAMHYRWNFDDDNLDFILQQFGLFALPQMAPEERGEMALHASGRMRKAAVLFGVTPETAPQIEAAYEETLAELDAHFTSQPYLLGGAPTIGDYGLFAALFAHLGRDPHPLRMMQEKAQMLFRWTERMRNPSADMVEFLGRDESLLAQDAIPDTLKVLLRRVAADYLPEVEAMIAMSNDWLAEHRPAKNEMVGGESLGRGIGMCQFAWRGVDINAVVMPYRIFMLQRIQDAYDKLGAADQKQVDGLLAETGLEAMLTARCNRRVERQNHREVWV
ncbi:MAG: glutathione S-transferase [Rhodobiaceae bacterium]|nr:glutathione S-transferase [Rhodobiaceae bacterium]